MAESDHLHLQRFVLAFFKLAHICQGIVYLLLPLLSHYVISLYSSSSSSSSSTQLEESVSCWTQQFERGDAAAAPCPQVPPVVRVRSQQTYTCRAPISTTSMRTRPHGSQTDTPSTHMNTGNTNSPLWLRRTEVHW